RETPVRYADAVLHRVPVPVPDCWTDGRHAGNRAIRLAVNRLILRGCAFSLHAAWRTAIHTFWSHLLLVSQGHRQDARRDVGQMAFLATGDRFPSDVRPAAFRRRSRHAATHLHLCSGSRMGGVEFAL